jgi:hypothetical protein
METPEKDEKCKTDDLQGTDSHGMHETTSQEQSEHDNVAFESDVGDLACPDSDTMFESTIEEQIEDAVREAVFSSCVDDEDAAAALSIQANIECEERGAGAWARVLSEVPDAADKVEKSQQNSAIWDKTVACVERPSAVHIPVGTSTERANQEEEESVLSGKTTLRRTRARSRKHHNKSLPGHTNDEMALENKTVSWIAASMITLEPESYRTLRILPPPRSFSIAPKSGQSTKSGQHSTMSRTSPPQTQHWRLPRNRDHSSTSMVRIHTDYILSSDCIKDINHMLDHIHNWSRFDAENIIKSFENDHINADRKVTFIGARKESIHWFVLIEKPDPSYQSRVDRKTRLLPSDGQPGDADVHPVDSDRLPDPHHATMSMEQAQRRIRMIQKERRLRCDEDQIEKEEDFDDKEATRAIQQAMLPPPRPVRLSLKISSPSTTLETGEDNLRLTPAQWASIEPAKPPPTPRLKHAELPLHGLDFVEPSDIGSSDLTSGVISRSRQTRHVSVNTSKPPPRPELKYANVSRVAKSKRNYFAKALQPSATQTSYSPTGLQSSPPTEDTSALQDVEKYRVDISHMLTDSAVQVAAERTKQHQQQILEPWRLDPDRY